ncbi:flagellar filament capping protein FliD [Modicisalibacter coralii]|uniref:flagellar filament capping protein FliD n=1 Tax=Modicisalibacter coralii TaxID=2304602 RepID=UPI00100B4F29|nr:flagellar filament capping protein FliD [Halomonas coralii]
MASISSLGIGSGLDLNGLLDQLKSSERQQLAPITKQQSSYKAKISAFGKLESALDKFQQAAAKLKEADTYQAVSVNVTGEKGPSASAGKSAVPGSYQVHVTAMAQGHSLSSVSIADKTAAVGAGTFTISQAGADDIKVDVSGGDSLEDLRDAVNDADGGVSASIINDGSGYRLVLSSKDTGAESTMSVSMVAGDGSTDDRFTFDPATFDPNANDGSNGMIQTVEAQDAQLTVNNIAITSASNHVEESIQGVAIDITQESVGSDSTVTVSRDESTIKKDVQSFVDAYNSLQSTIGGLTAFNSETGVAGQLLGDSSLRNVETQLRRTMSGAVEGGEFSMLSDIGVELQLDGTLKVDDDKLDGAISDNLGSLQDFFVGSGDEASGLAVQLDDTLSTLLDDDGVIDTATTGYQDRIDRLNERYDAMESRIDATVERYRKQFADMDSMVAQMNSTMSYLSQQFQAMNARTSSN